MAELLVDIPIKNIAKLIMSMNKQDVETLYLFLTDAGEELLERKNDVLLDRVKFINRDEAFNV